MSQQQKMGVPRDIVEGGPERSPEGRDEQEQMVRKRGGASAEPDRGADRRARKEAPSRDRDELWDQQPGTD